MDVGAEDVIPRSDPVARNTTTSDCLPSVGPVSLLFPF